MAREPRGLGLQRTPFAATLRRYRTTAGLVALVAVAAAASVVVREASPSVLLGRYSALAEGYSPLTVVRWTLVNLADLSLYVGVVGLAGFVLGAARGFDRRLASRGERAFVSAAVPLLLLVLVQVGAFSTSPLGGLRIHDRNLFYLVPLLLVGTVAWIEQGLPRPRRLTLVVAAGCALLPALIPYRSSLDEAWVDQIGIAFWLSIGAPSDVAVASMVCVGLAGAALIVLVPHRARWLLVGVIVARLRADRECREVAGPADRPLDRAAPRLDRAGGGCERPRDSALRGSVALLDTRGHGEAVDRLLAGRLLQSARHRSRLDRNASARLDGAGARILERGRVVTEDGRPLTAGYLLVDTRLPLRRGELVAQSRSERLALWRVDGAVGYSHRRSDAHSSSSAAPRGLTLRTSGAASSG